MNLEKEWDYNKNKIDFKSVSYGSKKKYWWKCPNNHSYEMSPNNRTNNNSGCPYCAGKKVLKGFNDILTAYPELKNSLLETDLIHYKTRKNLKWKCSKNHIFNVPIKTRLNSGCPYCNNKKVLKEFNDIQTLFPESINNLLNEEDKYTLANSKKMLKWKCTKNHIFEMSPKDKLINNFTCPYCGNRKLLSGFNDLQTVYPDLVKELISDIDPTNLLCNYNKPLKWKCKNNHIYQNTIFYRVQGQGCPYCSGNKVLKGYNDLLNNFPDICEEWDYNKNIIKPDEVTTGSGKKVYWKCTNNHSYQMAIVKRTKQGSNCPQCNNQTSFGEQCIYYYLLPYNAKNRFKLDNMEIDVYLPKMNIGIEFNGEYWHKNKKEKDLIKELKLSHKATMYYVCESDKNEIKGNKIFFNKEKYNLNLEWALKELFNILNLNIDVNLKRDKQFIYKNSVKEENANSLSFRFPHIAKEWNYKKNTISPKQVTFGSGKIVWWMCSKGHEYEMKVLTRVHGQNCPICSNHRILKGYNDLLSDNPTLCKEWDYELNIIKPDEVTKYSSKKVWWKCSNNHSFQAIIENRNRNGTSCPFC